MSLASSLLAAGVSAPRRFSCPLLTGLDFRRAITQGVQQKRTKSMHDLPIVTIEKKYIPPYLETKTGAEKTHSVQPKGRVSIEEREVERGAWSRAWSSPGWTGCRGHCWHWLVVMALGITWILDGLEVTLVGNIASR